VIIKRYIIFFYHKNIIRVSKMPLNTSQWYNIFYRSCWNQTRNTYLYIHTGVQPINSNLLRLVNIVLARSSARLFYQCWLNASSKYCATSLNKCTKSCNSHKKINNYLPAVGYGYRIYCFIVTYTYINIHTRYVQRFPFYLFKKLSSPII
jgi:hypothetical protein